MKPPSEHRLLDESFLIGAWECYKSDGIHGARDQVMVFRRQAGQLEVDYWSPRTRRGNVLVAWQRIGTERVPCGGCKQVTRREGIGIQLTFERGSPIAIYPGERLPSGQETFMRVLTGAVGASTPFFRRIDNDLPAGSAYPLV
jgi:hypothetical protein